MSVAVEDRPLVLGTGHGGMAARRAVVRWAWRLFRREWRQQSLVLALLVLAVAATTAGLGVAANTPSPQASSFGTADHLVTLNSTGAQLDADVAALRSAFGSAEVIEHRKVPVPGSANTVDLRAQDPHGSYGRSLLRLNAGRFPQGPDEIAVTDGAAKIFNLRLGGTWDQGGRHRTVVGLVENPLNLRDRFALVAPGQAAPVDRVTVLIRATDTEFRKKPRPAGASVEVRSPEPAGLASVPVLLLATIGMLFVGLLAVAGFTVMAQRRLRALGMLGAIGASHRHIRLVLVANGAVLGAVGALAGAAVGLAAWFAFGPQLEPLIGQRIDRFHLPWLPLLAAVLLAVLTSLVASWWPARAAARVPVVAALSGRPAPTRPTHRFAALGGVLLLAGLASIVAAQQTKPWFIVGGVVGTAVGLLLLSPIGIALLGRLARFAPLAPRLAMRDLARYRARSSAALAAIGLAVGIAAAIALSAGVDVAKAAAPTGGNLPSDQIIVWLAQDAVSGPVPELTQAQADGARQRVDAIAADLHATAVVPLQAAVDPNGPQLPVESGASGRPAVQFDLPHRTMIGGRSATEYRSSEAVPLFLATTELLRHYGVDPTGVSADIDVVTRRADFNGYDLIPIRNRSWQPKLQHTALPAYTSLPTTMITAHAMQSLGLTPIPVGWLIQASRPLTQAGIDRTEQAALAAGLSVETRPTGADVARLADQATGTGIAVALGVLAMTVGLIRSETARDLRTLTAAGARRGTRRALTAATAGSLALLGAVLGTVGAYLALLAWNHREPHWLGHVPVLDLAAIVIGLPLVAYAGAWLLAGKEPGTLSRQPVD